MSLDLDALEKVAQEAKSRNDQSFGLDDFGDLLIGAGAVLALIAELKDHRRTIRIWKVGEREAHLEAERDALQAKLAEVIVQAERDFVGVPALELLAAHQAMAQGVAEWLRGDGQ